MEKSAEEVPLSQIVYQPTTISNKSNAEINKQEKSKVWFVYAAAVTADLLGFTAGISFSWTSPVLPKLNGKIDSENNPLGYSITSLEESWIASLLPLGCIFGPLIAGRLADKLGRKRTLILISGPMILSLLMSAYATTILMLYIARFFMGISVGSLFTVLPIFLHEIAENHNRGTVISTMGVAIPCGLLFSLLVGPYFSVKYFCLICLVPAIVFLPLFILCFPETPQFLAAIGDSRNLELSLSQLRRKSRHQVTDEIADIKKSLELYGSESGGFKDLVQNVSNRRGILIVVGLLALQQLSGINPVISYMQSIFEATKGGLEPEVCALLVGIMQVFATIFTSVLVDRLGRKILFLISSIGSTIGLICLGGFFHLKNHGFDMSNITWLPLVSVILFMFSFNIGLGPLPWTIVAELFPQNVKSLASTIATIDCFFVCFLITLIFPQVSIILGMANSFLLFSSVCIGIAVFVYIMLPETKGRTVEEIQLLLRK